MVSLEVIFHVSCVQISISNCFLCVDISFIYCYSENIVYIPQKQQKKYLFG